MFSPANDRAARRPLREKLRAAASTFVAFVTLDDADASARTAHPVRDGAHDRPHRPGPLTRADAGIRFPAGRFGRLTRTQAERAAHVHHRPLAAPAPHRRAVAGRAPAAVCLSPVDPVRPGAAPLRPARLVWTHAAATSRCARSATHRTA